DALSGKPLKYEVKDGQFVLSSVGFSVPESGDKRFPAYDIADDQNPERPGEWEWRSAEWKSGR
ncbi:MAG TPA: hypothetical protein VK530_04755, partial [Candidatus Acidoferrum sp.]|nr:hypothetical protein [Candidatus Acidoferrum sp.]